MFDPSTVASSRCQKSPILYIGAEVSCLYWDDRQIDPINCFSHIGLRS
jgi:hypothetical protein